MDLLLIGIGSGIGGIARYLVSLNAYRLWGQGFPYGTLTVNLIGSFLIGFLFILFFEHFENWGNQLRAFFIIGFLGGFTTFSSFSLETVNLLDAGEWYKALANIMISVVVCLLFAWIGILVGRRV